MEEEAGQRAGETLTKRADGVVVWRRPAHQVDAGDIAPTALAKCREEKVRHMASLRAHGVVKEEAAHESGVRRRAALGGAGTPRGRTRRRAAL